MASITLTQPEIYRPSRLTLLFGYMRRNIGLGIGLFILLLLVAFTLYGLATADLSHAYPLSVKGKQPPSWEFPLGTDFFGRDLYVAMVVGLKETAAIGFLAGALGTLIGVLLGFVAAYFGGWLDTIIKGICQILTPIPALLIQVIIAGSLPGDPSAGPHHEGTPVRFGCQAFWNGRPGHHIWGNSSEPAAIHRRCLCKPGVHCSLCLVLTGSAGARSLARAVARQYDLGSADAECILQ